MAARIDFIALARELGGHIDSITMPNGAVMTETSWAPEAGRALLARFDELAAEKTPGDMVDFGGHTDPWVMMGLLHRLRHCRLSTYLAVFDRSVPIEAYSTGEQPAEGQPVSFLVKEGGEDVFVTLKAGEPRLPFEMFMSQMNLPPIPEKKNVYVDCGDAKVLNLLGVALSLGENCRTLFVRQKDGTYRCAISNVDGILPGDDAVR